MQFFLRLLAAKYRPHGVYKDARSILVIHNLAHQVNMPREFDYIFLSFSNKLRKVTMPKQDFWRPWWPLADWLTFDRRWFFCNYPSEEGYTFGITIYSLWLEVLTIRTRYWDLASILPVWFLKSSSLYARGWSLQQPTIIWVCLLSGTEQLNGYFPHGQEPMPWTLERL